jgi:acyl carrier protein
MANIGEIAPRVQKLVASLADCDGDDKPLELDSLTLVQLVEALEEEFDLRVRPSEVVPENFGSVAAMIAFVSARV